MITCLHFNRLNKLIGFCFFKSTGFKFAYFNFYLISAGYAGGYSSSGGYGTAGGGYGDRGYSTTSGGYGK